MNDTAHYIVRIKEVGKSGIIETEAIGRWTRQQIINFYGLEEPEVESYSIQVAETGEIIGHRKAIMNTDSIIGKTLRYQDEWSGLDTEFEIKEAAKDTWRKGYCLRGDGERDFFFLFDDELKKLATDGEAIRENRQRDGSIITETFTLR